MPAIALWTPEDALLGALAPLGAALAAPPALVVDLDPSGPRYPGDRSLADLVADDPTEDELTPRPGVAVLRNGGVAPRAAADVVAALIARWPRVVLRLPPNPEGAVGVPPIPVRVLLPGWMAAPPVPGIWQSTPHWLPMPAEGVRLPVPRPVTVAALCNGRRPVKSPWIRAWRSVWRTSWEG